MVKRRTDDAMVKRRTDDAMVKRKRTKGQSRIYNILHSSNTNPTFYFYMYLLLSGKSVLRA
jgi:hypothetical protein